MNAFKLLQALPVIQKLMASAEDDEVKTLLSAFMKPELAEAVSGVLIQGRNQSSTELIASIMSSGVVSKFAENLEKTTQEPNEGYFVRCPRCQLAFEADFV